MEARVGQGQANLGCTLYDPGSWRCNRCDNILSPGATECPNFLKIETEGSKFGSGKFRPCGGLQAEIWGCYVRGADLKPTLNYRDHDPEWRGKYSGGARAQRQKAKVSLTEAEELGRLTDDAEGNALVAQILGLVVKCVTHVPV